MTSLVSNLAASAPVTDDPCNDLLSTLLLQPGKIKPEALRQTRVNLNRVPAQNLKLSIIVIFHDMQREATRTLYSLSTAHQRGVSAQDYEIIAVDNGSAQPLGVDFVEGFGPNLRLIRHEATSVSPVAAINLGVRAARGDAVAIIVGGVRMASPPTALQR